MADYNVGNIEIGISTNSKSTIDNLDKTILKLKELNTILKDNKALSNTKKINKELSETGDKIKDIGNINVSGKLSSLLNFAKINKIIDKLKQLVQLAAKTIKYASDYVEILNKYHVSFQDLYDDNLKLTNQLAQAFGFSTNTLMDYTATFNNMLKGLKGLSDETSATISQTLTKMAIDYSSLFNVSLERSMNAFQSAISGNIRTLRTISGFDVSETTIFSIYQGLGGQKTMRQLNQLEKRLLRIIAIQRQMEETGSLGDYARTIESVSNQIKIMKENLIELGKWTGMVLLVVVKPIIKYLNVAIIVMKEIIKSIAKTIAIMKDIDYDKEFASFGESVESTTDAVEELNKSLSQLGLDQLNILGSSGGILSGLSVEGNILNALQEYNMTLDEISYEAKEISENILKWLGYTKEVDEKTGEVYYTLSKTKGVIMEVLDFLKKVGKVLINLIPAPLLKIYQYALNIKETFSELGLTVSEFFAKIKRNFNNFKQTFLEIFNKFKSNMSEVGEFLNENFGGFFSKLVGVLKFLFDSMVIGNLKKAYEIIVDIGNYLSSSFKSIIKTVISLISLDFKGVWESIKGIIEPIYELICKIVDAIKSINGSTISASLGKGLFGKAKSFFGNLPFFASGGVVDRPTALVAGEYSGAKSNPEIIAPQSIMAQTFNESIKPLVNTVLQSNKNVVDAINSKDFDVYMNGRKVSESLYSDLETTAYRKGKVMFANKY